MRIRLCPIMAIVLPLIFAGARLVYPQISGAFAQLNGTVRDESLAVIPGVTIIARDVNTNRTYSTLSNEVGLYLLSNLPPSTYELSAELSGFAKFVHAGVVLTVGEKATIDITLKVAPLGEQITVLAEAPQIEPTRSEQSQVIGEVQIQNLPINGRQFIDFALLTPGVSTGRTSLGSTFTEPETTRVSFAGQRDLNNNVTVDGAENITMATGSQRAAPSQEAVREFRVVNNSFAAEFGRALGGFVNIVTKSGTNELHGSLYEYLRNNALDARSILTLPQFDVLRQNQYGFTLGGPIKRDKTFFFTNYEGQRKDQSPTYPAVLVENLADINKVKLSLGLSAEDLGVLRTNNYDQFMAKIDHQLTPKNSLSVRYNFIDSRNRNLLVGETLDGGGLGAPSSGRNGLLRDQSFVANNTSVISHEMVNSLLFQYARRSYDFKGVSNEPNLDIPNLLLFGHNFGTFDFTGETRLQFAEGISFQRGKHYLKFGFDVNHIRNFVVWPGFTPARVIFPTLDAFLGRPPFGSPLPVPFPVVFFWGAPVGRGPIPPAAPPVSTGWEFAFPPDQLDNFLVRLNHNYWGFYGQDQWRITPDFTLNYGVRYDFETGLDELVDGDFNNIQPRIGFAYSFDDKRTVVRGGYGIFHDKYSLTFFFVSLPERPPQIAGLPVTRNMQTGTFLLNMIVGPAEAIPAFFQFVRTGTYPPNLRRYQGGGVVDRESRTPYSQQASLQIDRQLTRDLVVSAGYLFVAGRKLVRPEDLNIAPPIGKLPNGKDFFGFGKIDPDAGLFYYTSNSSNSAYHGMTLSLNKRYSHNFSFNVNYTLSKAIDDATFATFISTPENRYNKRLERGLSNQDVRHRFVLNFTARAPNKSLLRDFALSAIATLESPRPFTMFVGFDVNQDGNPVTDRVGLSGRNTFLGDNLRTVDLRLSRGFNLSGERLSGEFIAEFFNVFNTVNVNEVNNVYGAPDFLPGQPQPARFGESIVAPIPSFGTPKTVFNARQIQFAFKLYF